MFCARAPPGDAVICVDSACSHCSKSALATRRSPGLVEIRVVDDLAHLGAVGGKVAAELR